MNKKILSFTLILTLVISVFTGLNLISPPASAFQIYESGDYEYTVNPKNEIKIRSYLGNDRQVVIPSEIDGKPVVEIGEYSFNGIERHQDDGIKFENHPNAWHNKRIKKITVPSSVRTIGEKAFGYMDNLSEVVFSEGLKTIKRYAFIDCPKLEKISLPDSLVDFTLRAFEETSIEEIVLGSNVKYLYLEVYKESKIKKITCNADEIYFERVDFEGDSVLEEIIINGYLRDGFSNKDTPIKRIICNGEVSYEAVLSLIGSGYEFRSDDDGNNIIFSKDSSDVMKTYDSDGFRYYVNEKNEAVITRYTGGESNVVVPPTLDGHTVTAIAPLAFSSLNSSAHSTSLADDGYIDKNLIISVLLPDTVKTIGKYAFSYNLALKEINIPSGIEMIPADCFYGCKSLKEIVLPETVAEIGNRAFRRCSGLVTVEMQGVEKIGKYSFDACTKLSVAGYSEKLREVGEGSFAQCNLTGTLDLSSLTKIGSGAFDSTNITKVILNNNLEKLEGAVFQGCRSLEEINFPSKLVSIGEYCFRDTGLCEVVLNEGLKEIGALAFDSCNELYILELPESIEIIGNFAFENSLLEIVVIPENLRVIGYRAFGYCKELEILYFNARNCRVDFEQDNVDETDDFGNAPPFLGCNLKEIYFGEGVTSIGGYSPQYGTFESCYTLESVIIPDNVSRIGNAAFKNCFSLETAVISDSVTEIADDAFDGCDNLTILCFKDSYVYSYAQANGIKVSTFVVAPIPNQTYTGYEITPEVTVSFSGDELHKAIDFSVSYANNINAGEGDVTVKGKGDYKNFSNKVKFTIVAKNISSATVAAISDQPYTGSSITPELIVTDGTKLLSENKDYIVVYSNNKREGTASVKISGIGNYSGSLMTEFRIVNMNGTESFFSRLISEISFFFAKIIAFITDIFSFT